MRADHGLRRAGPYELVRDRQRIDKARAGGIDVERMAAVRAQAVLQQARLHDHDCRCGARCATGERSCFFRAFGEDE